MMFRFLSYGIVLPIVLVCLGLLKSPAVFSAEVDNSVIGNNNMTVEKAGVAINGNTAQSTINNNQNTVSSGSNTNQNLVQPVIMAPAHSQGGSSALVLPRNPLSIQNAALGRSAFHLQFGLNNNPGFSSIFRGSGNALGWFMQGGVSIPFGKIPDILAHPRNGPWDDVRMERLDADRQVFGRIQRSERSESNVQGRVVSMNAYHYATTPSPKIDNASGSLKLDTLHTVEAGKNLSVPKILALVDTTVFSKPLGKGEPVGRLSTGDEMRYIGHTNSGWVKIMLADGRVGWTQGHFEYLKSDYTEIDVITLHNPDPRIVTVKKQEQISPKAAGGTVNNFRKMELSSLLKPD
jgi:hypothetical protein